MKVKRIAWGGAVVVLTVIMLVSVAFAESDFRSVRWGMTKDEIQEIEGRPDETSDDMLLYKIEISGVDLVLGYRFIENTLVEALFANSEGYLDDSNYYDDYQTIKKSLTQVYGEPDRDVARWDDNTFKGMWSEKMAFQIGVVDFYTEWETDRTMIEHILRKKDIMDASHIFRYQSLVPEHQDLIKQEEQEELEGAL